VATRGWHQSIPLSVRNPTVWSAGGRFENCYLILEKKERERRRQEAIANAHLLRQSLTGTEVIALVPGHRREEIQESIRALSSSTFSGVGLVCGDWTKHGDYQQANRRTALMMLSSSYPDKPVYAFGYPAGDDPSELVGIADFVVNKGWYDAGKALLPKEQKAAILDSLRRRRRWAEIYNSQKKITEC
jgi:hypothetical protein